MKKGRPGLKLSVLVAPDRLDNVCDYLLENTSTIGLRYHLADRKILDRRAFEVPTKYGTVRVKEVVKPSGRRSCKIEYESIKAISQKFQWGFRETQQRLYAIVLQQLYNNNTN